MTRRAHPIAAVLCFLVGLAVIITFWRAFALLIVCLGIAFALRQYRQRHRPYRPRHARS